MQDLDYQNIIQEHEDYPGRSGCGPILITLVVIVVFWAVVGGIYLFT